MVLPPHAARCVMLSLLACLIALSAGCAAAGKRSAKLPHAFDPEQLYLKQAPYDRLFVKVDRLEGVKVEPAWLAEIQAFLATCCPKPGGVKIVQGEPIPLAQARDLDPAEIAGLRIDGPPANLADTRTAYLYLLFYDSEVLGRAEPDNPHVSFADYPCAVYYDVAYARNEQGHFAANALRHEIGHALGLCKNTSHGDGAHCENEGCLMYSTFVLEKGWYTRPPVRKHLCEQCRSDLQASGTGPAVASYSFRGPMLVRQEEGYWVMNLPGLVALAFDSRHAADWRSVTQAYRRWLDANARDGRGSIFAMWQVEPRDGQDARRIAEAIDRARRDPSEMVRRAADKARRALKGSRGQPVQVATALDDQWAAAEISRQ